MSQLSIVKTITNKKANTLITPKITPPILLTNLSCIKLINFSIIFEIISPEITTAKKIIIKEAIEIYFSYILPSKIE